MRAGAPRMCTATIAFVCGESFRSTSAGSIVSESSTSATTGTAPTASTAVAVEIHVYAGTTTSSPGPISRPTSAQTSALVPEFTARAWGVSIRRANAFSSSRVFEPRRLGETP